MGSLIEALPGISLPVSEVVKKIANMWGFDSPMPDMERSEYRATQINIILHFGLKVSEQEAREQFSEAVAFAQRYPCRIVVLCPEVGNKGNTVLEAKLFSQCYIGQSKSDIVCCEALILSYPPEEGSYLENQVSIWLDNDLPTCHWFHRLDAKRLEAAYLKFTESCQRIIYDSSSDPEYRDIPWPEPEKLKDLAESRMLNVRQSIGQFLSTYAPNVLIYNLETITIRHPKHCQGEAEGLIAWQKTCVDACLEYNGIPSAINFELEVADKESFELIWTYGDDKYFKWSYALNSDQAHIEAQLNGQVVDYLCQVHIVSQSKALAISIFS